MIRRPPAEVRQRAHGEKPLAWARVAGDWVVATRDRLFLPMQDPITWDQVIRAAWDDPVLELQLAEGPYRLVMEQPGLIPELVNERVKASVVVQHHVALQGDKGVRIVARRKPGGSEVMWRVTFDAGLDPGDPVLRAQADAALADLRTTIGL
ncbi:MAG: hypothetical protein H6526_00560 [Actinobacteria bacterium]|nr:hypothetical protein [Actinomycetota bacterium]MCB9413754.1 hypothetical protein [Actinomycetota bacterium]MCB9424762.1 hypothetical protein [Actinomycetota bacterium]HRY10339.1 hypothetical protein [Candidatus Nanopelagicales bacterium]